MKTKHESPYEGLKRVFHEPSRMAIVTALCGAEDGLTFGDLKQQCVLTDGNLNRHLKALSEARAIKVEKIYRGKRHYTQVSVTDTGRAHFLDYLRALEDILRQTARTLAAEESLAKAQVMWNAVGLAR